MFWETTTVDEPLPSLESEQIQSSASRRNVYQNTDQDLDIFIWKYFYHA